MKNNWILGIDPGLNHTGWAIISENKLIDCGIINGSKIKSLDDNFTQIEKISYLLENISRIIPWENIHSVAIEEPVVNINPRSSLKLCKAQGAIIALAIIKQKSVFQYSPTFIKKIITGNGFAPKEIVKLFVERLISINNVYNHHVFDAIAIAMAHTLKETTSVMENPL